MRYQLSYGTQQASDDCSHADPALAIAGSTAVCPSIRPGSSTGSCPQIGSYARCIPQTGSRSGCPSTGTQAGSYAYGCTQTGSYDGTDTIDTQDTIHAFRSACPGFAATGYSVGIAHSIRIGTSGYTYEPPFYG